MKKVGEIVQNMIATACPESPVDIHFQNEQLKTVFSYLQEREPMAVRRAIKGIYGGRA